MDTSSFKINDYILRGGENLNAAAKKSSTFPAEAERVFNRWYETLGEDVEEKENYLELPVDDENRIFIRAYWVEPPGHRPICYYVGLVVPKELYRKAGEYYRLHKGLVQISIADIQIAMEHGFESLELSTAWSLPRPAIGLGFEELSRMKRYGEKEYAANLTEMCLALSINQIDEWFSRLVIAVNPSEEDAAYHIVISKKRPHRTIPEEPFRAFKSSSGEPYSEKPSEDGPSSTELDFDGIRCFSRKLFDFIADRRVLSVAGIAVAFVLLLFAAVFYEISCLENQKGRQQEEKLESWEEELGEREKELEQRKEELEQREKELGEREKELKQREEELEQREEELRKLEKKLGQREKKLEQREGRSNPPSGNENGNYWIRKNPAFI